MKKVKTRVPTIFSNVIIAFAPVGGDTPAYTSKARSVNFKPPPRTTSSFPGEDGRSVGTSSGPGAPAPKGCASVHGHRSVRQYRAGRWWVVSLAVLRTLSSPPRQSSAFVCDRRSNAGLGITPASSLSTGRRFTIPLTRAAVDRAQSGPVAQREYARNTKIRATRDESPVEWVARVHARITEPPAVTTCTKSFKPHRLVS